MRLWMPIKLFRLISRWSLTLSIVIIASVACDRVESKTERELLLDQAKTEGAAYIVLGESSPEVNELFLRQRRIFLVGVLNNIERSLGPAGKTNATLTTTRTVIDNDWRSEIAVLKEMKQKLNATNDHLFYYRLRRGTNTNDGWLISSGGKIKHRFPIGVDDE